MVPQITSVPPPRPFAAEARGAAQSKDGIIARTVLLRGVPLFRNLLTLHVSNLAKCTQLRHVAEGEHFGRAGEALAAASRGLLQEARSVQGVHARGNPHAPL